MKTIVASEGRTTYIVRSPEEAASLKRAKSNNGEGPDSFDCQLHGSPEHVDTLRRAYELHASSVEALRKQDPSKYEQYERIRGEMDILSHELHDLAASTPDLQQNFDRYGYRPHIRTYDDVERATGGNGPQRESTTMKLYSKPVLRQYFHDGILYRTRKSEETMSFELFLDLLYVGIIGINGDKAAENPTSANLLLFCVTFLPSWRIWTDVRHIISYFTTEDLIQRYVILLILSLLLGFTTNISSAFDSTYASLITYFLFARFVVFGVSCRMAYTLPHIRPFMLVTLVTMAVPSALWLGSIFVHDSIKEVLIWLAILGDTFGGPTILMTIRVSGLLSERLAFQMNRIFNYYPAMNIEHTVERWGSFVSLVFGYSVVALLYQNQAAYSFNGFYGKAVLGLVQAYSFNMIYFDIDGKHLEMHALRRHAWSAWAWLTLHLPFVLFFTIAGAALSRLVVASDCRDTNPETLTETYQEKSIGELPMGLRWYYCGGLAGALFCMTIISASHVHHPVVAQRLSKRTRLVFRTAIALIWALLPLAKSLNSLDLIAITSTLTVLVFSVDIYGTSSAEESFFGGEEHAFRARESEDERINPEETNQDGAKSEDVVGDSQKKDRHSTAASRKYSVFLG